MTRVAPTLAAVAVTLVLVAVLLWQVYAFAADGLSVEIPTVPARSARVEPEPSFPPTTCTPAGACITETPAVVTRPVLPGVTG